MEPAIAQLDPHLIHRARSQLRITREYAERALASRNVDEHDKLEPKKIQDLCDHLVTDYPSHGFVISSAEAKRFGLPIRKLAEYRAAPLVNSIYTKYSEEGKNVCLVTKAVGKGQETGAKQPSDRSEDMEADRQDGEEGETA